MNIEKKSLIGSVIVCSLLLLGALIVALASPISIAQATSMSAPTDTIMYAKPGGLTSGACDTWGNACELRYALSSSVAGQEIWVAQGVYTPTTSIDRTATFQLKSGVAIYGGFAMTETLRTERDPAANVTVLSGDIDHNDVVDAQGVVTTSANIRGINSYHVVTGATDATLDGVTITGGNADGSGSDIGGGMYNFDSSPALTNVAFIGNSATYGGGVGNEFFSNPTLTNVTFSGNAATSGGGGMGNEHSSSPTLTNVTFSGNTATDGGGMANYDSYPTLTNVTFSGNAATHYGGGMYNNSSSPQMRNTILWGDGPSEMVSFSSTPTIIDSVAQRGCPPSSTCVRVSSANPLLGPLGNYTCSDGLCQGGGSTRTFALLPGSSAIDATSTNCPATDQRGVTRGSTCDIGAFESQGFTLGSLIGTPQSATINAVFAQPLGLSVTSAFSEPVAGGVISFTAPTSGASLAAPTTFTKTISASGSVSATVTANGTAGSYAIIASTSGATSVTFALTNTKQILYVRPSGATSGICESWGQACELRYALNLALPGPNQEIWVAAGVYTPTEITTDRAATFQLKNGVAVYGGFAMTETLRTQRDPAANVTVLSGDIDHNDGVDAHGVVTTSVNIHGANSYHVVTGATDATLDGVTITGGNANGANSPDDSGAGMYNFNSSPTLTNITFSGNAATYGGGMFNYNNSRPTLTNVTFSGNAAATNGGGIFNWYYSDPMLTHVTFSGNSASSGGGMYNVSSNPQMRNTILWGDSGGEIYNSSGTPTINDSVVQGGCPSGSTCTHVISADPLLTPLGNFNGSTPTFALLPGSSAIDATSTNCPATDQRGVARGSTCDIGAFESQGFTLGSLTGTPQSALPNTTFAQPLGLKVTSAFSEPVAGGVISFTAPTSGASIAGTKPFTKTISVSGDVSATVTANAFTGAYTVTASARGATSVTFALANQLATTTTLTSAPNPAIYNQMVTFTATVTSTLGMPSGSVTFYDNGASLGSGALTAGGQATLTLTSLIVGAHPITATYGGDVNYNPSTSSVYTQTVLGQILYAKPGGATSGVCESWANGCELRYALNIAIPGSNQEIWAAAGVYNPTTTMTDRAATFQLVSGVAVYGGFAMTETLRTQRNPATNIVVLSGDIDHNDGVDAQGVVTTTANITGTNSYHVVTGATGATLDGVTITAGNANGSPSLFGGGMYNDGSSPTLNNVIFSGNAAAAEGGGMYNSYSSPMLTNVTFRGNSVLLYGGGMFNYNNSSPTLTNVTFSGNSAYWGGGMVNENPSSPTLTNVTFSGNSAYQGGGICGSDGLQMQNSLLWGDSGGEICNDTGTATISDSVVQGGCPSGITCTHVILADPLLAPLGNYGGSTPTFALLPGSSAIDATSMNCPATDQRGVTRGSTCDIGAFESQGFTLLKSSGDGQSTLINTAFAQPLGLSVISAFGEPVAGGVISFTAHPAMNGASLAETMPFAKTISASGAVSATVTANGLTGSYTVTASANGAASVSGTTSVDFTLTNQLATTTTLTSAPNPSTYGQAVTFTATVTSSGGTPTGSITFTLDATTLNVPLDANGQAVYVTQTLAIGHHPVSAAYGGDSNFTASSGVLSGGQTVTDVPITGLNAVNSSPTRLTAITFFTATMGTGSNVTYTWNFGDGATGSGANSTHTYASAGTYTAIVTATNGAGRVVAQTTVYVTTHPIAQAGQDQSVRTGQPVTLNGSASLDPGNFVPLTYQWQQTGGSLVTLSGANTLTATFTSPAITQTQVLTFELTVTNSQSLTSLPDEVVITVEPYRVMLPLVLR